VLAAAALWRLATAMGARHQPPSPVQATPTLAAQRLSAARR
jgi:hypothetical protein